MSLDYDWDIAKTGSVVTLTEEFANIAEDRYPDKVCWHREFCVSVCPLPQPGEKVDKWRVEFVEVDVEDTTRGFSCVMNTNNTIHNPSWKKLEDIKVIEKKVR